MQAVAFSGAGKQCTNLKDNSPSSGGKLKFTPTTVTVKSNDPTAKGDIKLDLANLPKYKDAEPSTLSAAPTANFGTGKIKVNVILPVDQYSVTDTVYSYLE